MTLPDGRGSVVYVLDDIQSFAQNGLKISFLEQIIMQTQDTLLPFVEINPPTAPVGSVIWLHGLGADGHDFAPIVPELHLPSSLPLRFLFPHAPSIPVTINNGYVMPAWYDITSFDRNQRNDLNGMANSVAQINSLIENEKNRGIPSEKIVLAGFSQGAVIALMTGLQSKESLAGILALSGYLPYTAANLATLNKTLPIFLAHGTEDNIVPYQAGLMAYDLLQREKFSVSWHAYPMAHGVCNQEIKDIGEWLRKIFG